MLRTRIAFSRSRHLPCAHQVTVTVVDLGVVLLPPRSPPPGKARPPGLWPAIIEKWSHAAYSGTRRGPDSASCCAPELARTLSICQLLLSRHVRPCFLLGSILARWLALPLLNLPADEQRVDHPLKWNSRSAVESFADKMGFRRHFGAFSTPAGLRGVGCLGRRGLPRPARAASADMGLSPDKTDVPGDLASPNLAGHNTRTQSAPAALY